MLLRGSNEERAKLLRAAFAKADQGNLEPLAALLRRHSQFPGPKPNLVFADEVVELAQAHDPLRIAEQLLAHHPGIAPGGTESEFLPYVGVLVATRAAMQKKRELPRVLGWIHDASDDLRFHVRDAAMLAWVRLLSWNEKLAFREVPGFATDLFSVTAVVRALSDKRLVEGLSDVDGARDALERAVAQLDEAPRSAARYPGYKALVAALPVTARALTLRLGESMLTPFERAARSPNPDLHGIAVALTEEKLLRSRFPEAIERLGLTRNAAAPQRIDPRTERLPKGKAKAKALARR